MYPEDVYMSYKVDEVPIKGKKGSTKVEEYEEFTARPDRDANLAYVPLGIPMEIPVGIAFCCPLGIVSLTAEVMSRPAAAADPRAERRADRPAAAPRRAAPRARVPPELGRAAAPAGRPLERAARQPRLHEEEMTV